MVPAAVVFSLFAVSVALVSAVASTASSSSSSSSQYGTYAGFVVSIDAGHQDQGDSSPDPIGPGSNDTKACVSSGAVGPTAGPEPQINLDVALRLHGLLVEYGVTVVMTRVTGDVDLCNSERAIIGNNADADLVVRIHCDAGEDHVSMTLYPGLVPEHWTDAIYNESLKAAAIVQQHFSATSGIPSKPGGVGGDGIFPRTDLTGFNWSTKTVVLVEMYQMQNLTDDALAATPDYRQVLAQGLYEGILAYLDTLPSPGSDYDSSSDDSQWGPRALVILTCVCSITATLAAVGIVAVARHLYLKKRHYYDTLEAAQLNDLSTHP
ncbi:N-acetylmuramoyl-L-alanine amidase [Pelomyxa schiedti]|nr:N-acetylmuramoyl-L-alanine amidase [Pelomyxa schiedti]